MCQQDDRKKRDARVEKLLGIVGMSADADRLVSTYSKGMAQRIGVAQALMNDPELVLLDEPTDGVDPVGRRDLREVLNQLRAAGKTVFINSHQLDELDALCDRVAILVGGEVRRQGTLADLALARQRYEIEIAPTSYTRTSKRTGRPPNGAGRAGASMASGRYKGTSLGNDRSVWIANGNGLLARISRTLSVAISFATSKA